ncbi:MULTISPECIES: hypothetical protein [Streptomyces]|uniref:Lipoprotein n=2 Tax=Streptomyces bottropensis TaxID=42235 RepID=M3FRX6_9ACTN|nr:MULTISPECIES: hypothetical protein [Streptomyces]EMF54944.1 lipoprotein [Streptomyces bottropensis ATCC 25435]MZD20205.1 hypothetical protein [Streptomyces sp. SID5476]
MRLAGHGSVRRRRGVGIAVVAALLGGATTACGTEAGAEAEAKPTTPAKAEAKPATPAEAVARAAERTTDIASLRYRVSGTLPEHGRIRVEAAMTARPTAMRMELTGWGPSEDKALAVRFADGVIYAEGDASAIGAPAGKKWISAGPAVWGRGAADNNTYRVLPGPLEASPLAQSTLLTGAKKVSEVGAETVDGGEATHYRGTVTTRSLRAARTAARDKATREARTTSLDQFMMLGIEKTLTVDLWVDDDGRAKRYRLRGETYALREGRMVDAGPLDLTVTLLDVDRPVTVETPAAADTVDLAERVDGAGEG